MKDSLTNRRPFTINNIEGQNDLKARWYKGAREITYKLLDLRKKNYKDYTIEKPPLHVKTLMKDNWLKYGDWKQHQNCHTEAWESLVKWGPTKSCMVDTQEMAGGKSLVHFASKTRQNSLIERLDKKEILTFKLVLDYGLDQKCMWINYVHSHWVRHIDVNVFRVCTKLNEMGSHSSTHSSDNLMLNLTVLLSVPQLIAIRRHCRHNDECSSYGTWVSWDSSNVEPTPSQTTINSSNTLKTITVFIAAMDEMKTSIVEKLPSIGKVIGIAWGVH